MSHEFFKSPLETGAELELLSSEKNNKFIILSNEIVEPDSLNVELNTS